METKHPLIILDTDMETDCDDAGALALLLESVKAGKADLAGIIASVPSRYAAPACEAIINYYGISVEIGAVHLSEYESSERFSGYFAHRDKCWARGYNEVLASTIQKTDRNYEEATTVYRRLLSRAKEKSICILLIGTLTALDLLLRSQPDSISNLSGKELVERKVSKIIAMTNALYPFATENFNWDMDGEAAERVLNSLTIPITASPEGSDIISGYSFSSNFPENHPVRIAYERFTRSMNKGRSSWDVIATLYAVDSENNIFETNAKGQLSYDSISKITKWTTKSDRKDELLRIKADRKRDLTDMLEKGMLGEI